MQNWQREIFWGDKGKGSIQNVETYGIEVPAKTEKFDFLRFWGYQRCGEYSEQGEQMGLRSL